MAPALLSPKSRMARPTESGLTCSGKVTWKLASSPSAIVARGFHRALVALAIPHDHVHVGVAQLGAGAVAAPPACRIAVHGQRRRDVVEVVRVLARDELDVAEVTGDGSRARRRRSGRRSRRCGFVVARARNSSRHEGEDDDGHDGSTEGGHGCGMIREPTREGRVVKQLGASSPRTARPGRRSAVRGGTGDGRGRRPHDRQDYAMVFVSPAQRAAETAAWFLRGAGQQLPDHAVIPGLGGRDATGGSPEGMAAGVRALLDPAARRRDRARHQPHPAGRASGIRADRATRWSRWPNARASW